jgi:hypothetical protein
VTGTYSTLVPSFDSRYFTIGSYLRASSVGFSSGMPVTRTVFVEA